MLNFLTCISTTLSKQAVKALARLCVSAWADPVGGDRGPPPPPPRHVKYHKNIGFPSNTRPDPLKNHKVTKPAFNVGPSSDSETPFKWRFAGGSMLARLWWYLDRLSPHQLRKKKPLSTSDRLWQNFQDLHKMRKLVGAFTMN